MKNNNEKIALIIGGSRGIGRAIGLRLAKSGFNIWLTYRNNHAAAQMVKTEIEKKGRTCDILSFDVSDYSETEAALGKKVDALAPDVVVYNPGITRDNLLVWMTKEEWSAVISTNLNGFYNVMHLVMFPMLRGKKGRIVVISSTSGQIGLRLAKSGFNIWLTYRNNHAAAQMVKTEIEKKGRTCDILSFDVSD
ncbi:unnamed protein product [marine sediment metagenome]|uniref:3-oxoacyl-[acyl-carrier-protein] reductase n=1 Tax=marine sediment metagenome TaxID=412755 RepID=X1AK67_9ZZZZ